jgi:hypothetical protein
MILKKGSTGENVKILQRFLSLNADGSFGPKTEEAVKVWQRKNGLTADGIVGPKTWDAMGLDQQATTDLSEQHVESESSLSFKQYYLPKDEYLAGPTKKEYLFLHHTAGGHNPYSVVDMWARDTRGRIATEFVLGGPASNGKDNKYDGELIQCVPTGGYGWHLGDNGSMHMHKHSVGIEVCNYGFVTKGGYRKGGTWVAKDPGSYYNYAGGIVIDSHVTTLAQTFRGHKTWHRYSDKQLEVLKEWILYIADRDDIDVRKGLIEEIKKKGAAGFEFNEDAFYGRIKGMWTHTNTRKDKVDMFPQQELIDMLLSI